MASLSHRKKFKSSQKITSIVLLCIASQFSCVTNIAEVIKAIAKIISNVTLKIIHAAFCFKRICFSIANVSQTAPAKKLNFFV